MLKILTALFQGKEFPLCDTLKKPLFLVLFSLFSMWNHDSKFRLWSWSVKFHILRQVLLYSKVGDCIVYSIWRREGYAIKCCHWRRMFFFSKCNMHTLTRIFPLYINILLTFWEMLQFLFRVFINTEKQFPSFIFFWISFL